MVAIVKRDPWATLFNWPHDLADYYNFSSQRGLKIHETATDIVVEAVVAGVPAQQVDVNIEDGVLTIKAEVSEENKSKEEERSLQYNYYYSAALSGGAWDKANAEVEHGIVKVIIPKAESAKPRKISVKTKIK